VTTFLGEGTQHIDPAAWSLTVRGLVDRPVVYSLADLRQRGERDVRAVLDCTSGWALDTSWRAIPLAAILDEAAPGDRARRVDVRAITGWTASFDLAEARQTWLATGVAGAPLAAGNGAPCRLIVPGRRGLDWVKWVSEIVVSDGVVLDL
jgi:DMSO/TMAO reductase YedYZ molybdopterin-dependent catalytic subunit